MDDAEFEALFNQVSEPIGVASQHMDPSKRIFISNDPDRDMLDYDPNKYGDWYYHGPNGEVYREDDNGVLYRGYPKSDKTYATSLRGLCDYIEDQLSDEEHEWRPTGNGSIIEDTRSDLKRWWDGNKSDQSSLPGFLYNTGIPYASTVAVAMPVGKIAGGLVFGLGKLGLNVGKWGFNVGRTLVSSPTKALATGAGAVKVGWKPALKTTGKLAGDLALGLGAATGIDLGLEGLTGRDFGGNLYYYTGIPTEIGDWLNPGYLFSLNGFKRLKPSGFSSETDEAIERAMNLKYHPTTEGGN